MTCFFSIKLYIKTCSNIFSISHLKMNEIVHKWKKWLFFITFLTSFIFWIFFSNLLYLEEKSEVELKENLKVFNNSSKEDLDLTTFWEVYDEVKKNYYSFEWIKNEELVNGMIKWMVESLWDKHSEFMNIEEQKQFEDMLSWDFEWIGAVVETNEIGVIVERLISGSPAKNAWVLSWDIIIKANGEELKGLSLYEAVGKIKGPAGTKVMLTIIRGWENDIIEKEVTRDKIKIPSVNTEYLDDGKIWYIALNMFWDTTDLEFKSALADVKSKNVEGLIIDLRDNGGWYLQSAVQILSHFVENNKTLVQTKYRNSFMNQKYISINDGEIFDKKIVIIINWNSASASEITAWALSDYGKAIIVWEKSYWKGSVQEPYTVKNGLLKLTIARWFTPNGTSIEENGITPDIEIKFTKEDFDNKYDRQKEEAIKILKDFIKNGALQITIDSYLEKNKKEE